MRRETLVGLLLVCLVLGIPTSYAIPDPSAEYCQGLDYDILVEETEEGQVGICKFPDGSSCPTWDFLQGKCGEDWSYCKQRGYEMKTIFIDEWSSNAVCVLPDGGEAEVLDLMQCEMAGGKWEDEECKCPGDCTYLWYNCWIKTPIEACLELGGDPTHSHMVGPVGCNFLCLRDGEDITDLAREKAELLPSHTLPSPSVSSDTYSLSMHYGGDVQYITFTVSNNGGDSDTESYLSISVSSVLHIEEWSSSSSDMNFKYSPIGSKIGNSEGNQITSEYELLDAYEAYSAGETNTVTIKVKATASGSQWIKYRTAFDTLDSGYDFIRNPTSGPLDQQKWHTYEIPAEVTDRYTLEFEGYDLDAEKELKININGLRDIYLPASDDLNAENCWWPCEVDITNFVVEHPHNIITFCNELHRSLGQKHNLKDIKILKNGKTIRRFHPKLFITQRYISVEYEFDPEIAPVTCTHAGMITIEMYAPTEV